MTYLEKICGALDNAGVRYDLTGKRTESVQLPAGAVRVLCIDDLIEMKRRSGRAQDLEDVTALEKLR